MKIYRNEKLNFEIVVPDEWEFPRFGTSNLGARKLITFKCNYYERFEIQIEPLTEELSCKHIEEHFNKLKLKYDYSSFSLGRILVGDTEHVWARWYLGGGRWKKKYKIINSGNQYEIIATCLNQNKLLERERIWDKIVGSFRDPSTQEIEGDALAKKSKDSQGIEEPVSVKKPKKTYRNKKHSFEIDIPEEWQPIPIPIPNVGTKDFFQYGCYDEAFNFEIDSLLPETSLNQTERDFVQFAMFRGFSELKISRITVGGKEHVCARYHIQDSMGERWNKKYMIVFNGIEYAITATADNPKWFEKREEDWDEIVQSFCLLGKPML